MSDKERFWRSTYRIGIQFSALCVLVLIIWWLGNNLINNLNNSGIPTSFGFLNEPTDFAITDNPGFDNSLPFWRAVLIGTQNTLLSGVFGIFLATILGVVFGIARLSSNWLVAQSSKVYVETFRNIPVLCIILFFGFALFTFGPLPIFSDAYILKLPFFDENFLVLSNRTIGMPSFRTTGDTTTWWIAIAVIALVSIGIFLWRTNLYIKKGIDHHRWLWALGFLLIAGIVAYIATDNPYRWSWPSVSEDGRVLLGGFATSSGYLSLTLALAVYTSSHIAEIIRGSIQAIPKGQGEAAYTLNSFQKYRFVILPQAFRISVPATINQYLNLMKNTSLGIAVAYTEIAALIRIGIGNDNPAPQSILIMMAVFLVISLTISLIGNAYNKLFLSRELVKTK